MARPLRIEFPGALYHVTSRGNAQADIFRDDDDRQVFLDTLGNALRRHDWLCHAYCLMDNHYHLLLETASPTLSKGMQYLNGTYTQYFNRRHGRVGHVFQGRFKAILVDRDAYLLELARYVVLNPVRAGAVRAPEKWRWSSYAGTAGTGPAEPWLTTDWLLGSFGQRLARAQEKYRDFVQAGRRDESPWAGLQSQIYLGNESFVRKMQARVAGDRSLRDVPRRQTRAPAKSLDWYGKRYRDRNAAIAQAYLSGHYTLEQVGEHFGVSYATVSRVVKRFEAERSEGR